MLQFTRNFLVKNVAIYASFFGKRSCFQKFTFGKGLAVWCNMFTPAIKWFYNLNCNHPVPKAKISVFSFPLRPLFIESRNNFIKSRIHTFDSAVSIIWYFMVLIAKQLTCNLSLMNTLSMERVEAHCLQVDIYLKQSWSIIFSGVQGFIGH